MDTRHVTLNVLGTSLTIKSDEEPEYMSEVVTYLEQKIKETEKLVKLEDPLKVCILSALLLTDELLKERRKKSGTDMNAEDSLEIERIAADMIRRIETSIEER